MEHDGFTLLLDPGYGVVTQLSTTDSACHIDAVFVSHGHPDHYADLHPLLRGRVLLGCVERELPIYAFSVILDPGRRPGLPHFVPNIGIRLTAGGSTLAYTGDTGPSPEVGTLGRDVHVLIADATFPDTVPDRYQLYLSSAGDAADHASRAGAGHLVLAHLWPGADHGSAADKARDRFDRDGSLALPGTTLDVG